MRRPSRTEVRQRLFEAAVDCLVSHGYGAASVEVITQAAGLSRGALYSNFTDKEDLYLQLLEELEHLQLRAIEDLRDQSRDLEHFLELLSTRGTSSTHDPRSHAIVQTELWLLAMRNEPVRERLVAVQRRATEALAGSLGDGALGLTALQAASMISALGDGLMMHRMLEPDSLPDTILVDALRVFARAAGRLPDSPVAP